MKQKSDLSKNFISDNLILILSFLITAVMCILLAAACNLAPFGNKTLAVSDAYTQYVSFWSYYRDLLMGDQDPFYALEMTIGANVRGLIGYYALNPFNLIFLFFPTEKLVLAMHIIVMLNLASASLMLGIFFKKTDRIGVSSLIFTSSYGFCGYVLAYFWCINWLGAYVLLPAVALGIHNIVKGKKPTVYIISLSYAIILNYYTGFMLCIFSVIYFIYCLLQTEKKPSVKILSNYITASLLSGGISAAWLMPAVLSIQSGKRESFFRITGRFLYNKVLENIEILGIDFDGNKIKAALTGAIICLAALVIATFFVVWVCRTKKLKRSLKVLIITLCSAAILIYASVFENKGVFLQKLLIGFCDYGQMWMGYPNIYIGISCLVFAGIYFLSPEIKKTHKRNSALLLFFMLLSMHMFVPNMVWHGFTTNSGFNYRYSFIFSFILLSLGHKGLNASSFVKKRKLVLLPLAAALISAAAFLTNTNLTQPVYYLAVIAETAVITALIYVYSKRPKAFTLSAIMIISMFSIFAQAKISIEKITAGSNYEQYKERVIENKEIISTIKTSDNENFRVSMGKYLNDPMLLGYNGVSHFSSNESTKLIKFMEQLGIAVYENVWASGIYGRTEVFDSFFGVKYFDDPILSENAERLNEYVYKNKNALPLAFICSDEITKTGIESDNAFENQNKLFKAACPEAGEDIFTEEFPISKDYINLREIKENRFIADGYTEGYLIYKLKISSPEPLYFYCDGFQKSGGEIRLNGEFISKCSDYDSWRCIYLGNFQPGDDIELRINISAEEQYPLNDKGRFFYENLNTIHDYHEHITAAKCSIHSDKDSEFIFNTEDTGKNKCILFTVPYDPAWIVEVDGEKSEAVPAYGELMAIKISEGSHEVVVRYLPPGIITGAIISTACLILAAIWICKKKSKPYLK